MILENREVMWSKLGTPEKKYGSEETQWSIILLVDDVTSKRWVKDGTAMKEKSINVDGKDIPCIKIKKDTHWRKSGEDKTPVVVVDMHGLPVDPRIIGNGTIVNAQYTVRDWEFQGRKGRTPELVAIQVVKLEEYEVINKPSTEFNFLAESKDEEL